MNKDGTNPAGLNGRKASLSQGVGNAYGVTSPSSATRPSTRRRETLDSNPFSAALNSPTTANRPGREEAAWPPRKNELKESEPEEPESEPNARDPGNKLPFGNLIRSNTSGSVGMGSIWSASNPGTPGAGAFGNFALGGSAIGAKPTGGGTGGSRLAHLMPKDSSEGASPRQGESQTASNQQQSWRSRQRTDTDPFGEELLSGSAVLGGAQDIAAVPPQAGRVGTLGTPVKGSTSDFGMSGLNLGGNGYDEGGLASPSETNPYRSPPAERHDQDDGDSTAPKSAYPHDQTSGFNPLQQRGFGGLDAHDRSQTSSAKGFPLGHMSAWGAPGGPTSGTPDRERANFGNGPFSPALYTSMNDIQSPSLGNIGSMFGPASAGGMGSIGRGSKLGSLFPSGMQAQMQSHEHEGSFDSGADLRQTNPLGAIGRSNLSMPMRETESPLRSNRGVFEELFPSSDTARSQGIYGTAELGQASTTATTSQPFTPSTSGMPFGGSAHSEAQSAQARMMVMPDRMRWVYLDPQANVQGPFTGLEMNDWYKAHFFTPDLRVKKVEDADFEPLGQLIRRIGNSREPFLVPQVGIPHGPPAQASAFPGTTPGGPGGIVPPLSGVFPSFGRTLTAEEQNNLERRKQEEQYLMAQQRDYVMRQQAMGRFQAQQPGLQHHSSAQSLQSQPSFGSIQSPVGQLQQPPIGAVSSGTGFFDPSLDVRGPQGGSGNEEPSGHDELAHLSATERQMLVALQAGQPQQSIGVSDVEGSLRGGLPLTEQLGEDPEGFRERLQEFEVLRAQHDKEQAAREQVLQPGKDNDDGPAAEEPAAHVPEPVAPPRKINRKRKILLADDPALSLTQQVQQTQAAAAAAQTVEPGMPMPFPPPTSTTPLPAPTAQRVRSNLPEQYSRSHSGSPADEASNAPPPLAPWAKEPGNDAHKGPSLKEIQEAEARKAARAEEAAAALRKAALEQEAALIREKERQVAAAAAGLPATSTWGHASPVSSVSPWTKPGAPKPAAPGLVSSASSSRQKTLAEIQAEEERRKQKAKDSAVQSGAPIISTKSYANLAGKSGQPLVSNSPAAVAPPPGAGWAVVGASGKPKPPPTGPALQIRSVSTASAKVAAPTIMKPTSRPGPTAANGHASSFAMDEFRKWVNRELARGINVNDSKLH